MRTKIISLITILVLLASTPAYATSCNTNSATLNGTSSYFTAADSASLSVTGNLTLQTWVKFASLPPNDTDQMSLVSKYDDTPSTDRSWDFKLRNVAGTQNLQIRIRNGADNQETSVGVAWTPSLNVWYNATVVYTAAGGTADFYVNGTQQGTQQSGLPTDISNGNAKLSLGAVNPDGVARQFLNGQVDDVRVWATARTASAISGDYQQELIGNETNLNAYWKLNNNLVDSTANGNTLTNVNSATFTTDVPFTGTCVAAGIPKLPDLLFFF